MLNFSFLLKDLKQENESLHLELATCAMTLADGAANLAQVKNELIALKDKNNVSFPVSLVCVFLQLIFNVSIVIMYRNIK